jgi:hypothetical protein
VFLEKGVMVFVNICKKFPTTMCINDTSLFWQVKRNFIKQEGLKSTWSVFEWVPLCPDMLNVFVRKVKIEQNNLYVLSSLS